MTRISRRTFLVGGATLTTATLLGQWGRPSFAQGRDKVVNLYSARHYDTDEVLYSNFTKRTGIRVNLVQGEADPLLERIRSEGLNSPADVFITVDAGRLWRAQEAGILQPIRSQVLTRGVPASLRDPDGFWFGLTRRARVIIFAKDRVDPSQLSTYEALANQRWRGKVLIRSSKNIYNLSLMGAMIGHIGVKPTEAWARGVAANLARPPQGGDTDQIRAVAAGVGDLALSNTYYLVRLMKSSKPVDKEVASKVGVFFPNQRTWGTHVNISGGGVVKTAPNREAAQKFLEYLISPEAQEIFARSNNEYPVLAGVAVDPVLASLGTFKADSLNAAIFARNNAEAVKIADRSGWA